MLNARPEKWGVQIKLDDALVACTLAGPDSIQFTPPTHAALIFLTPEPRWQIALNSDKRRTGVAPAGALEIVPANHEVVAGWTVQKHSLRLDFSPDRLKRLAGMEFDRDTFEFHSPKVGLVDEKAHTLARWMRAELQDNGLGAKEGLDALATLLAVHLLRNHSSLQTSQPRSFNGGLPVRSWRMVNDYIQTNVGEPLSLERLASITQLSPSHFLRAFKQTTGQTPYQYVIAARLAYARNLIINTDTTLGLIAKAAGFSSNSHMSATMQRIWNTTPSEIRKERYQGI